MSAPIAPLFMEFPGEPPIPYSQWKFMAKTAISCKELHISRLNAFGSQEASPPVGGAQQAHTYDDSEKNMDLFNCLGTEGQRRYMGTSDFQNFKKPNDSFFKILDALFDMPRSRLIALQKFRHRFQGSDETAALFATELRALARDCKFEGDNFENREIADTLVLNCVDKGVQQKLFALSMKHNQKLTVEQVLTLMQTEESSKQDVQTLSSSAKLAAASIHPREGMGNLSALKSTGSTSASRSASPTRSSGAQPSAQTSASGTCHRCGKAGHRGSSPTCPARHSRCRKCSKIGHWDSVCRSASSILSAPCLTVSSRAGQFLTVDLHLQTLNGFPQRRAPSFHFVADTGAQVNTIRVSDFRSHFKRVPLMRTRSKIKGFCTNSKPVAPLGLVKLRSAYSHSNSAELQFFIVPNNCPSLLGLSALSQLGLQLDTVNRRVFSHSSPSSPRPEPAQHFCTFSNRGATATPPNTTVSPSKSAVSQQQSKFENRAKTSRATNFRLSSAEVNSKSRSSSKKPHCSVHKGHSTSLPTASDSGSMTIDKDTSNTSRTASRRSSHPGPPWRRRRPIPPSTVREP